MRELREVNQRPAASGETEAARRADVAAVLSNVERAINDWMHFHPVSPRDVEQLLKEVRDEVSKLQESLEQEANGG